MNFLYFICCCDWSYIALSRDIFCVFFVIYSKLMSFFALVNCIKQTHEPFIFIKLTLKLKGILSLENSKGGGGGHHFRSL